MLEEQGRLQDQIEAAGAWDLDSRVAMAMDALRLPPGTADVATLSGGECRRVALCRLLLQAPDLLLLDEPTNHLDAETVAWLERFLAAYRGTVVAVTHDRYFLDNVAGWILELDRGEGIPWEGNYSSWLDSEAKAAGGRGQAGGETAAHLAARARVDSHVASSPPGERQGKAERLRTDVDGGSAQRIESAEIYIPPGPRLGNVVVETDRVCKGVRRPSTH